VRSLLGRAPDLPGYRVERLVEILEALVVFAGTRLVATVLTAFLVGAWGVAQQSELLRREES
jgi:hypothetical protein